MSLPWFRMYARFVTDPVIEELSFEDQRHFVFILCLKCDGLLDKAFPNKDMRERAIARRLGLQGEAFTNAKQRLVMSGLVDQDWQPRSWDDLQFKSDSGAARQREWRKRHRNVTETAQDSDTDTDKNPKGRARDGANPKGAPRAPVIPKGEAKAVLQRILAGKPGERKPN